MLTNILLALAVGLIGGVVSGLFGVGGGVVLVPLLIFVFRYPTQMASATSLVALLLPVGLLGVLEYYRAGKIEPENIKLGLIVGVGLFIGAYFGARFASSLSAVTAQKAFAIFLFCVAVHLWITASKAT